MRSETIAIHGGYEDDPTTKASGAGCPSLNASSTRSRAAMSGSYTNWTAAADRCAYWPRMARRIPRPLMKRSRSRGKTKRDAVDRTSPPNGMLFGDLERPAFVNLAITERQDLQQGHGLLRFLIGGDVLNDGLRESTQRRQAHSSRPAITA